MGKIEQTIAELLQDREYTLLETVEDAQKNIIPRKYLRGRNSTARAAMLRIKSTLPKTYPLPSHQVIVNNFLENQGIEGRVSKKSVGQFLFLAYRRGVLPGTVQQPKDTKPYYYREKDEFYESKEWRHFRYQALKESDGRCKLCGRSSKDKVTLHVDHIKPRSLFPKLALDPGNLQVLCEDCNMGKSNKDDTDWRHQARSVESPAGSASASVPLTWIQRGAYPWFLPHTTEPIPSGFSGMEGLPGTVVKSVTEG